MDKILAQVIKRQPVEIKGEAWVKLVGKKDIKQLQGNGSGENKTNKKANTGAKNLKIHLYRQEVTIKARQIAAGEMAKNQIKQTKIPMVCPGPYCSR